MVLPTSGLEPTGVELVVKGIREFEQAIERANRVLNNFSKQSDNVAKDSTAAGTAMNGLSMSGATLAVTLGTLAAKAISAAATGFVALSKSAFMASAEFERTQIAFRTMIGDVKIADALLRQVSEFATRTPFAIPEVEKLARQFLGMGFSINEIIPSMRMLGDVSAGVGAPLERIAFNYAQIRTQQKAYTIDLRQFAMAGIPIYEELAKVMDVNVGEIRKLTEEGKIGFAEVEQAFINMTGEGGRFFDLMNKQSKTVIGSFIAMKNELIVIARQFGAPLQEPVAKVITVFRELFAEFGPGGSLEAVTAGFAAAFTIGAEGLANFAQNALDAIRGFAPRIETEIFPSIRNALIWGAEFSANFAKGIIEGAAVAITMAVRFITSLLTFWLAPDSPPRITPDLDIWGADAFTEYLRGFSNADFGVLSALQSPIKSALDALKKIGTLSLSADDDAGAMALAQQTARTYQELSTAIAKAVNQARTFGTINQQVIAQVASSTGQFGSEIAKLLELELRLVTMTQRVADANDNVTRAQKNRSDAQKALEGARSAVEKAQDEVARLQEELFTLHRFDIGGEITISTAEQLQAARAHLEQVKSGEIVAENTLTLAQQELDAAEVLLDIERQKYQIAVDGVNVQKDLVNQLLAMQDMQLDPFKAMKDSLKGAGEDLKGLMEDFGSNWPELDMSSVATSFDETFARVKEGMLQTLADVKAPFQKAWDELFLGTSWGPQTHTLPEEEGTGIVHPGAPKGVGPIAQLQKAVDDFVNSDGLIAFQKFIGSISGEDAASAGRITFWSLIVIKALQGISGAASWFAINGTAAGAGVTAVLLPVGLLVGALVLLKLTWDELGEKFKENVKRISELWPILVKTIKEKLFEIGYNIGVWIAERLAAFEQWKKDMKEKAYQMGVAIGATIREKFIEIKTDIATKIQEWIDKIATFLEPFKTAGKNIIQGLWDGLKAKWLELKTWFEGIAQQAVDIWNIIWGNDSPSKVFMEMGKNLMKGLEIGVVSNASEPLKAMSQIAREMSAGMSLMSSSAVRANSNVTNYNVNANYSERQTPARISDDLRLLTAMNR